MSVYFIQTGRYFKIGYAEDAQRRFDSLHKSGTRYTFPADASWAPEDRTLYRVIDGDKDREHAIHLALDGFSVGLEWFLDEPEVRHFIDSLPTETDRHDQEVLADVQRPGGWCFDEHRLVQQGRAKREMARYMAKRAS